MTKKRPFEHTLKLPKPGQSLQTGPNGHVIEEFEYDMVGKTNNQLKEMLQSYNLCTTGNKDQLKERLEAFSNDRASWLSIYQPLRARVRGGGMPGNKRQSGTTKRIVEKFGKRELPTEFHTRKGAKLRILSKTKMPEARIQQNNEWANKVLASFTFCVPQVTNVSMPGNVSPSIEPLTSQDDLGGVEASTMGVSTSSLAPGSRLDGNIQDIVSHHINPTYVGVYVSDTLQADESHTG
ncbi:hypothetical protein QCA50_004774 [Cerrena zonata]|uniref:SAP domain-containing protein n=1 Tax=Cerrena zonata TaxID=2478898 RepID=A0AAW0GQ74_9APHY